jgi:hypothetical protein
VCCEFRSVGTAGCKETEFEKDAKYFSSNDVPKGDGSLESEREHRRCEETEFAVLHGYGGNSTFGLREMHTG